MSYDEDGPIYFDDLEDEEEIQEASVIIDRGLHPTESIDLKGMMEELDSHFSEAPVSEDFAETSFGKLMQALPIPSLFIGPSRKIVFANLSCERISVDYKVTEGSTFDALFPDPQSAQQVKELVEKVFDSRKTQVLEGILQLEDKKIWARAHLRSLWWGMDQAILVLIEDLTLEKTQLILQKRLRKELEKRVDQRTAELRKSNEQLQNEILERKKAEQELRKHRQDLEELVADRTKEVRESLGRLKREIKERKQIEKSLRSTEHRFNVAFRANPAAVAIATLEEGRYIEVNNSFCRLLGYDHGEIVGRTAAQINHWAKPDHREEMIRSLLEGKPVKDLETVFRAKNSKMIVTSVSAELIDLDGQSHVLTIATDITDKKRAEADRNRMITAFEHAAETIIITDDKGMIKYANPAFEAVSGYTRSEVRGKPINRLRSQSNDKKTVASAKSSLNRGVPWRGRLINTKRDGSHYEVDTSISPVRSKSGNIINYIVVERDVR